MKYFNQLKNLLLVLIALGAGIHGHAQAPSGLLSSSEQRIGLATGMDYSILPIMISYDRGFGILGKKRSLMIGSEVTLPAFALDFNDVRIKLRTMATLSRIKNFEVRAGINPVLVSVKMQTQAIVSIGGDFHVFAGLSNEKWNTGIEFTYNHMFSSKIKHTDKYRDNVFAEAQDGWYKNTAANIQAGVLVSRRIQKFDVHTRLGLSKTGEFNSYLFVPTLYLHLGVSYRFGGVS